MATLRDCCLFVLVLLALLSTVHAQQSDLTERSPPFQCINITSVSICSQLGYQSGSFPNWRDQTQPSEADQELNTYLPVIRTGCSEVIVHLLCAIYAPKCEQNLRHIRFPPCKEICLAAREGCEPVFQSINFQLPSALDCDRYPSREKTPYTFCYDESISELMLPLNIMVAHHQISNCTVPAEPTNGIITATLVDGTTVDYDSVSNTVLEGTVLTYQCDNGLFGSVNITCMSDGEWSSDPDRNRCFQTDATMPSDGSIIGFVVMVIAIILLVLVTCFIVGFGPLYKRIMQLLKTKQLGTTVLRHDLDELPINAINPSLSTSSNDTQESTLSTNEVNSTELPPETVPQFPTTGNTAQVSTTDGHHSSISEPPIAIDDSREESTANKTPTGTGKASTAGTSVEEVSSAIANAWSLILGNVMKLPDLSESLKIPGSQLKLSSDPIGQGETGMVYKGLLMNWKDEPLQAVAVKTLKGLFSSLDIQFLMSEIIKMKDFNHPHVMPLIGVCLDAGPGVSMVMPHMTNGSVLDYLKKERNGLKLTDHCSKEKAQSVRKLLLRMCHQIALGMEYLSQQRFIHRDLAARNCMLNSSGDVRVGDFGLAEDVYSTGYFRQNELADIKLPYKWMALESLNDAIFTEKTDVWSYGVTMWEVFSGGQIPYPGVDVRTLVKFLQRGSRLDAPVNTACTTDISAVMQRCWLEDSKERPSFTDLSSIMDAMLSSVSDYVELNMKLPHNSQDPIDMSGYDDLNESLRNRATRTDQ